MPRGQDILVLGAGVIGLSSAIALVQRGHHVRILARDRTPGTTSDRAGARFTPFGSADAAREVRWARESWKAFTALAARAEEYADHGVRMLLAREFVADPSYVRPWWSSLASDFRPFEPPVGHGFLSGFDVTVPHMDISRYIPWLERECLRHGVSIARGEFASLRDVAGERFDVVVNCTGLGSRELVPDKLVRPMRGQVLRVANSTNLAYSLVADRPAPGGKAGALAITYVFAFPEHLVLGGTFEPDEEGLEPLPAELDAIVERCRDLARLGGHEGWRNLGAMRQRAWVGMRPARLRTGTNDLIEDIRLEPERLPDGRLIVHNYGHGRAGITFSWGCAVDVIEIIAAA